MPTETIEYERFEYKHFDEQPLSLEDAITRAKALREGDASSVYRVVSLDDEHTGFFVEKLDKSEVYASFLSRVAEFWGRVYSRSRRNRR